ncbi:TPA: hypothetical protein MB315_004528 [Klebsiella quasipneumoniae subsp. similipneumoniae]|nr:hypothetical protein [Klebsiella quasipneumoniae subsp. similipneumoniae]
MRKRSLAICSLVCALASVGCGSTPPARPVARPAPAAWAMQPAPDLQTPLNGIITPSGSGSAPLAGRLDTCRPTSAHSV